MAQQPAVVVIARHGPRLDLADQTWHLSTPTPYDPPLTYGGWNQSRTLGVRIASLLHAREQSLNHVNEQDGEISLDVPPLDDKGTRNEGAPEERPRKRRRVRHNVVIHSSPFLRCIQTSVAIAAGMAQYNSNTESGNKNVVASKRMHSASPRLRATTEGHISPTLSAIAEPKRDFAHEIARKVLNEHKRYRKSKLRVDAFLGEWLNPQYFESITPPPPSAMMVTTAKGELMENETVEIFAPSATTKPSTSSLWHGANGANNANEESALDDWSDVQDSLPVSPTKRDRSGSYSNFGASESGRPSPFRSGSGLQPVTSNLPKQEAAIYHPPTPSYAISSSNQIPRGYVAHARNACTNVDYQWDSSRPPQSWGDGGEYGEEWSSMHKRFRRGLNHLIHWYSRHNADDRAEDSLGFEQAEKLENEEQRDDLVLILVTHGAGCNALIGALTGQPVLLDVGMASLTMAVRKEDAPPVITYASSTLPSEEGTPRSSTNPDTMNRNARRSSLDVGLNSVYDMKLISSSEHLRPGADPSREGSFSGRPDLSIIRDPLARQRQRFDAESTRMLGEPARSNTSSALGTIRRPSSTKIPQVAPRSSSLPRTDALAPPTPPLSTGLWTPPGAKTPDLQPQADVKQPGKAERPSLFTTLSNRGRPLDPGDDMVLNFSNSPPDSRPGTSGGSKDRSKEAPPAIGSKDGRTDVSLESRPGSIDTEAVPELPKAEDEVPQSLSRGLSQKGLWGSRPSDANVERRIKEGPKRRWTVNRD